MDYIHKLDECDCCKQVELLEQIHKKDLERQLIMYQSQISTLHITTNQLQIKIDKLSYGY